MTANPVLRALLAAVAVAHRRPGTVLLLWLVLAAGALFYSALALRIDTDTAEMIDERVPFRRHLAAYDAAFPQLDDQIVAVVDGTSEADVDAAAALIARALNARPDLFRNVFYAGKDPFFERNGLLYLGTAELEAIADQISDAQPVLGVVAKDPSLRGMFDFLETILDLGAEPGADASAAAPLFDSVADVVASHAGGGNERLAWSVIGPTDETASNHTQFVLAQPVEDAGAFDPAGQALDALEAILAAHPRELVEATRVRLTGGPVLTQVELRTVRSGIGVAGLLSLILVATILGFGLRSPAMIGCVLATLLSGLVVTLGLATLTVGQLNLISVAFAVLFIGLAVDFGIHFALRYREERAGNGDDGAALAAAARGVGPALVLSAVTAAIGFGAFAPTDYRGLAELGIISAQGMGVALVANFTLLPALLVLLKAGDGVVPRRSPTARRLAMLNGHDGRAVRLGTAALTVAAVILVPAARIDLNPLNLQDPDVEAVATYRELAAGDRANPYSVNVLTDDLEAAEALKARVADLPGVAAAYTLADFVPNEQDEKLDLVDEIALAAAFLSLAETPPAIDPAMRRAAIIKLQAAIAGYAVQAGDGDALAGAANRLYGALESFAAARGADDAAVVELETALVEPIGRGLDRLKGSLEAGPVALADLPPTLRAMWLTADGRTRVEIVPVEDLAATDAMVAFTDTVQAVAPTAIGAPVIVTGAGRAVFRAFAEATAISLVAIVVLLAFSQRRPLALLLTLAPLVLAALWTVAAAAALSIPFNFANIIVLPLLFGLGASSSIHMVMRQSQVRGDLFETTTPRAVLLSGMTTLASFVSLAISPHRGMASMGLLLAIAIVCILIATLVAGPSLMAPFRQRLVGGRGAAG